MGFSLSSLNFKLSKEIKNFVWIPVEAMAVRKDTAKSAPVVTKNITATSITSPLAKLSAPIYLTSPMPFPAIEKYFFIKSPRRENMLEAVILSTKNERNREHTTATS